MVSAILVSCCGIVAWTTLFGILPWASRLSSLYALHGMRDRLYRLAYVDRSLTDTLLYRDAEFVIGFALHVARSGTYLDSAKLLGSMYGITATAPRGRDWRKTQYEAESRRIPEDVVSEIVSIVTDVPIGLGLRVFIGDPGVLCFLLLISVFVLMLLAAKTASKAPAAVARMAQAIEAVVAFGTSSNAAGRATPA